MILFNRPKLAQTAYAIGFLSLAPLPVVADPNLSKNVIELTDNGSFNALTIFQGPISDSNTVRVVLSGDLNGAASTSFQPKPSWFSNLKPGTIEQRGNGHTAEFAVSGIGNLFAISQSGQSNLAAGKISGTMNQVSVIQSGQSNRASFSQTGNNNSIAISQNM